MNYCNEFDPYAATCLRSLMRDGLIPAGSVDTRDIKEVSHREIDGYTQAHFFAGIGGWPHALGLAGWPVDRPVWTGSCPCQPFSLAGLGNGLGDARHVWPAWLRLISAVRPPVVLGEQVSSPAALLWWDAVACDLEAISYTCRAVCMDARVVGCPQRRRRLYWVACAGSQGGQGLVKTLDPRLSGSWGWRGEEDLCLIAESPFDRNSRWPEPLIRKVADGLSPAPGRVDRLRCLGNAIVPPLAAIFIKAVMDCLDF